MRWIPNRPAPILGHDCHQEYLVFAKEAPQGRSVQQTGRIETRHDPDRDSRLFSDGSHEIAAVEHETGVEILMALGVNVASAAIISFATRGWKRWRDARKGRASVMFLARYDRPNRGMHPAAQRRAAADASPLANSSERIL